MGLYSVFFPSTDQFNPHTFEKDLDEILRKITITEKRIVSFKENSSRFKEQLVLWSIVIYSAYVGYLYHTGKYVYNEANLYYVISGVLAPIVVYLLDQFLVFYNSKILRYYLHKIRFYKKQHEQKIADLKTKTNFNKTKSLLQKYSIQDFNKAKNSSSEDAGNDAGNDATDNHLQPKKRPQSPLHQSYGSLNEQDQSDDDTATLDDKHRSFGIYDDEYQLELIEQRYKEHAELRRKRQLIKAGLYNPDNKKNTLTKIFDLLMGTDETLANNRYALICINCFAHNGLAPPRYLPHQVKYLCFKCGHLNNPESGNKPDSVLGPTDDKFADEDL